MILFLKISKIMAYQIIVLIFSIFSCDIVWAIQILKFKKGETSNKILKPQMISPEKVMNIKVE
jgi:hypothetical protein